MYHAFFFFLVLPGYCYQPVTLHPHAHMLSHVIPWTAACQAPLSMDFSRQEYWSGLPFPSPCVMLLKKTPPFPFLIVCLGIFIPEYSCKVLSGMAWLSGPRGWLCRGRGLGESLLLIRSKAVQSPPPEAASLALADFDFACISVPRYWRRTLGMQVRYVRHEDYQFCYSFRGRPGHKPSILMLHGFSAHKDMWLSMVNVGCQSLPSSEGVTQQKKRREGVLLKYVISSGREQREPGIMAQSTLN